MRATMSTKVGSMVGLLAVAGAAVYGSHACSSADAGRAEAPERRANGLEQPVKGAAIPSFPQRDQARRYFDAKIEGDRRTLELLDQALAEARGQPKADPEVIAELEQARASRQKRLEAHEAAKP